MALAEPSGDFGRAGRSSWHYNLSRPLGRKAGLKMLSFVDLSARLAEADWQRQLCFLQVKLHSMASASFDGKHLPHMASLTGTWQRS